MIQPETIIFKAVPLVISVIALCVSFYSVMRALVFSDLSFKRLNRFDLNKTLLDIDAKLVDYPEIWAIFDYHPLSKTKSSEPLTKARREGYIYLCFGLFDGVFDYYENLIKKKSIDEQCWQAWKRSISQFFECSQEARTIWSETRTQEIYPTSFISFVNNLVSEIEKNLAPDTSQK